LQHLGALGQQRRTSRGAAVPRSKHADPDDADHHRDAEKVAKPEISISQRTFATIF